MSNFIDRQIVDIIISQKNKFQILALLLIISGLETSAQISDAAIEKKIEVLLKKMNLILYLFQVAMER